MSWSAQEFATVSLGDERLNKRLIKLAEQLSAKPTESIPGVLRRFQWKSQDQALHDGVGRWGLCAADGLWSGGRAPARVVRPAVHS
jgi:hypothetical protein